MNQTSAKPELTPEKRATIEAARDLAHEAPGPDELIDRGDIDEPVPHGQFIELQALMHALKAERQRKELSLTDVSETSGLTRAMISRLENGWNSNPTLDTLYRYAQALGFHIGMTAEELPPETKR